MYLNTHLKKKTKRFSEQRLHSIPDWSKKLLYFVFTTPNSPKKYIKPCNILKAFFLNYLILYCQHD